MKGNEELRSCCKSEPTRHKRGAWASQGSGTEPLSARADAKRAGQGGGLPQGHREHPGERGDHEPWGHGATPLRASGHGFPSQAPCDPAVSVSQSLFIWYTCWCTDADLAAGGAVSPSRTKPPWRRAVAGRPIAAPRRSHALEGTSSLRERPF